MLMRDDVNGRDRGYRHYKISRNPLKTQTHTYDVWQPPGSEQKYILPKTSSTAIIAANEDERITFAEQIMFARPSYIWNL